MTGSSCYSKPGSSDSHSSASSLPLSLGLIHDHLRYLDALESKLVLDSRSIQRRLLSWAGLLRAMLFVGGLAYATCSMLGEYQYAAGMNATTVAGRIGNLRAAGTVFPLNPLFRKSSALWLAEIAVGQLDPRWKDAALAELGAAVRVDPTDPVLKYAIRKLR